MAESARTQRSEKAKLREHLPPLRRRDAYAALRAAFAAGCDRNGFRLIHYAVLNDHLHFVVEASSRAVLSRGVQGLLVRIARTLNRLWQRRGRVFADRYHDRIPELAPRGQECAALRAGQRQEARQ